MELFSGARSRENLELPQEFVLEGTKTFTQEPCFEGNSPQERLLKEPGTALMGMFSREPGTSLRTSLSREPGTFLRRSFSRESRNSARSALSREPGTTLRSFRKQMMEALLSVLDELNWFLRARRSWSPN